MTAELAAERADRGRAARRKGHQAERDVARFLRRWWPDAERKADNGWRSSDRASSDAGDIRGTPICWQVKAVADLRLDQALRDTATQTIAAGADIGVLVERRNGHADPGRWWAWLTVVDLVMLGGLDVIPDRLVGADGLVAPVRLELRHVVSLLVAAGYADPLRSSESGWDG